MGPQAAAEIIFVKPKRPTLSKAHDKQTAPPDSSADQIIHPHADPLPLPRARSLARTPRRNTAAAMASTCTFLSLRLPTPSPAHAASSPSLPLPLLRQARGGAASSALVARAAPGAPSPLFNPRGDPFLSTLAAASPEDLAAAAGGERRGEDHLPFLEIFQNAKLMATPAQVRVPCSRACLGWGNEAAVI